MLDRNDEHWPIPHSLWFPTQLITISIFLAQNVTVIFYIKQIQMVRAPFSLRVYLITKNRKCLSELKPSEIYCKKIEWSFRAQEQEVQPGLGVVSLRSQEGVRGQGTTSFCVSLSVHLVFDYFSLLCYCCISLLLWRLHSSAPFAEDTPVTFESI